MQVTPDVIGWGILLTLAIALLLKIFDAILGGFFGKVGERLFTMVSGWLSSEENIGPQFTGSSFEEKLLSEIEDLNPRENAEVEYVDYDYQMGGSAILEYRSDSREWLDVYSEIERVAYAFATTLRESNNPCGELNVNVLDGDGYPTASYRIDRDWAESFNRDEIDDTEYIEKIRDTLEWMCEEHKQEE